MVPRHLFSIVGRHVCRESVKDTFEPRGGGLFFATCRPYGARWQRWLFSYKHAAATGLCVISHFQRLPLKTGNRDSSQMCKVHISCSSTDHQLKLDLAKRLKPLQVATDIRLANVDAESPASESATERNKEILADCDLVILIITSNYLSSDYVFNTELPAIAERWKRNDIEVIPLLWEMCFFKHINWLDETEILCKDKPVNELSQPEFSRTITKLTELIYDYSKALVEVRIQKFPEDGGEVLCKDNKRKFRKGSAVQYHVIPSQHYDIQSVRINGNTVFLDTNNRFILKDLAEHQTVEVEFIRQYKVTKIPEPEHGGEITSGTGSDRHIKSATPVYLINAKDGYRIGGITVLNAEGKKVDSFDPGAGRFEYTFPPIKDDMTLMVKYFRQHQITVNPSDGGTITSLTDSDIHDQGIDPTYTIIADDGYRIKTVKVDDIEQVLRHRNSVKHEHTFKRITNDHKLDVEFIRQHKLRVDIIPSSGGSVRTDNEANTFDEGTEPIYEVICAEGYRIGSIELTGPQNERREFFEADEIILEGRYVLPKVFEDMSLKIQLIRRFNIDVKVHSDEGGEVLSDSGSNVHDEGVSPLYTIHVNKGYRIKTFEIDHTKFNPQKIGQYEYSYQFDSLTSDHTLIVEFTRQFYLSREVFPSGCGEIVCENSRDIFDEGETPIFEIIGKRKHRIQSIKLTGIDLETSIDHFIFDEILNFYEYKVPHIKENMVLKANFIRQFHIECDLNPPDGGEIKSDSKSHDHDEGTSPDYIVIARPGYIINVIKIDQRKLEIGEKNDLEYTCKFTTLASDHKLSAEFIRRYDITVEVSPESGGTVESEETRQIENEVMKYDYIIRANPGYRIESIRLIGANNNHIINEFSVTEENYYHLSYTLPPVTEDVVFGVRYVRQYEIDLRSEPAQGGTVDCPNGTGMHDEGTSPLYTVIAVDGFRIKSVKIDKENLIPDNSNLKSFHHTFNEIKNDACFHVEFVRQYEITAELHPSDGGEITGGKRVSVCDEGNEPVYEIVANEGYRIFSVVLKEKNGTLIHDFDIVSTHFKRFQCLLPPIRKNAFLEINYKKRFQVLKQATPRDGGRITGNPDSDFHDENESVGYKIVPNEGYRLLRVEIDGVLEKHEPDEKGGFKYRFNKITDNHSIHAHFIRQFHVTFQCSPPSGGQIFCENDSGLFDEDESPFCEISPEDGYRILSVELSDAQNKILQAFDADRLYHSYFKYKLPPVQENLSLKVRCVKQFEVTIDTEPKDAECEVLSSTNAHVHDERTSPTYTIYPGKGYHVQSVLFEQKNRTHSLKKNRRQFKISDIREDIHLKIKLGQGNRISGKEMYGISPKSKIGLIAISLLILFGILYYYMAPGVFDSPPAIKISMKDQYENAILPLEEVFFHLKADEEVVLLIETQNNYSQLRLVELDENIDRIESDCSPETNCFVKKYEAPQQKGDLEFLSFEARGENGENSFVKKSICIVVVSE